MRDLAHMKRIVSLWIFLTLMVGLPTTGFGVVPQQINYQGFLTDDVGNPAADGDYSMTFAIYATDSGGTALWTETQTVPVSGGVYNVVLGQPGNEIDPADMDGERYLGVSVEIDAEMTPRQPFTASAFAMRSAIADDADTLDGMDASAFGDITGVNTGTGLSGGGASGTVTISADTSYLQRRVSGSCPTGSSIRSVSSTGTVTCEPDNDSGGDITGVTAGTGLSGGGTWGTVTVSASFAGSGSATTIARSDHTHSAANITSGTLSTYRYSAYNDLSAEGYLGNASGDIARNNGTRQVNLNADLLDGQHASVFVNTSATAQTKYGELTLDASAITLSTGIKAIGTNQAGFFISSDDSGYANLGYRNSGIRGVGNDQGGIFIDQNDSGIAYVGYGNRGIWAKGDFAGGTFSSTDNTTYWADVSTPTRKIVGTGTVSFVQNHPFDENTVIVYAAPEGDEVAVYTRGTARLVDGEARVTLGETFQYVANPDIGLTVYLTPVGEWSDLYVVTKSTEEIVVRSAGGAMDAAFDYIVYGLRLGFEEVAVLQPKERDALLPTAAAIEEGYGDRPDLRAFNAKERHLTMHASVFSNSEIDLSRTRELLVALEGQRPAALARAAARQEGMQQNGGTDRENFLHPSSAGPADASGAESDTGDLQSFHALIAEQQALIEDQQAHIDPLEKRLSRLEALLAADQ